MVMIVHSTEPFYLGGNGGEVLCATDAFWAAVMDALGRSAVPLFIIASSYLQFPLHYSTGEFFKRRAVRILVPMLIWTIVYALVWGAPVENFKGLLLNFNYAAGHLWFMYMLVGMYLVMPLLSPWAEKVSRKELGIYILIWVFTTTIPFIRDVAGGVAPMIQASDGLPATALFPLWGEASWNPFGTFYYVSGFIGYMLVGLYIKRFVPRSKLLGVAGWTMFLVGFIFAAWGFMTKMLESADTYPISVSLETAVNWEVPITFCSTFVAMMAIGLVLAFRGKQDTESWIYRNAVRPLSEAGYGMYLTHMLVLAVYAPLLRNAFGNVCSQAVATPLSILCTALATFA
ncbi:MAG: acyltransferase, partial [Bacteroidales bacterium]|nr:acyltransferase [Bacteroidales bacterium]